MEERNVGTIRGDKSQTRPNHKAPRETLVPRDSCKTLKYLMIKPEYYKMYYQKNVPTPILLYINTT